LGRLRSGLRSGLSGFGRLRSGVSGLLLGSLKSILLSLIVNHLNSSTVFKGATLNEGQSRRGMPTTTKNGTESIGSGDEGVRFDNILEATLSVRSVVQALEEFLNVRIRGILCVAKVLHGNMRVALENTLSIGGERNGIVVKGRVVEETGLEIIDLDNSCKFLVPDQNIAFLGAMIRVAGKRSWGITRPMGVLEQEPPVS